MRLVSFTTSLINVFVGAVVAVLGLRFVLRLFGANESAAFVSWVYETSGVLLAPFRGIFPTQTFDNNVVLELSTLFAIIVYAIVAMLLMAAVAALADLVTPTSTKKKK